MRGYPDFNFPAFDSLASFLRSESWVVTNPAEHDREVLGREALESAAGYAEGDISLWAASTGFSFAAAMQWDLAQVLLADAIVLLPGWGASKGARYERMVAEAAGKDIYLADPVRSLPGEWLVELDPCQSRLYVNVWLP